MKTSNLDEKPALRDVNTLFRFTAKTVRNPTPFSAEADLKQSLTVANPSLDVRRMYIYASVFGTNNAFLCLI